MTKIRLVVNPTDNRVHLQAVDEDNPTVDVAVCGESPGGMEGEWADMVGGMSGSGGSGFYPVPLPNICMKCFPSLKQFEEAEVPLVALDV